MSPLRISARRMRGAALLPDRFGSPAERIKLMQELYKATHTATDIFRLVFDSLSGSTTNVKQSIAQLDEKMTEGVREWLNSPRN